MSNVYSIDQGLPSSMDAERAVLGAILLDNGCIAQAETLTPAHFSLESHRRIYAHLLELWGDGIAADIITLCNFLKERNQIEGVGGSAYVASLTDGVPLRANIEHYVRIVNEKAQLRDIIIQANKAITRALEQQEKPSVILDDLNTEWVRIAANTHAKDKDIFLDVTKFIHQYNAGIDWRVEGAIEVGTNGMLMGMSGDAKSPAARALAVCLASGLPWLDLQVKRCRVALVSREDYAGTTARFIERFIRGNNLNEENIRPWLWVNSRAQIPSLLLDNPSDLRLLINNLKRRDIEFCILDVLNVLHTKDENDNTEMRKVLRAIDHIRDEVGCQVMVLHHTKKGVEDDTAIAESGRGSSAIAGFAEFKIRIRTVNEELGIRQMRFKTKAGEGNKGFLWEIKDIGPNAVTIERNTEWTPSKPKQQRQQMTM